MNDARPAKKVKRSVPPPKVSNRPRNSPSPSPSGSDSGSEDEADARARMLEQLEAHQRALLADVLPPPRKAVPAGQPKVVKPIWEMGEDDFEGVDDEDHSEEDDEAEEEAPKASTSGPIVVSFEEPRASATAGSQRDMLAFMSAKVKNARPTFSVADLVNVKPFSSNHRHKQRAAPANVEDEAHLASLDTALSSLIRPLSSVPTQSTFNELPSLLSSLPLAATKTLKGLTPLPANAPRTLRRGQMAANLDRARKRDESNGILAGAKRGREATTLKEKRAEEGEKRQRGLGGAVGKMTRGGLVISQADVDRIGGSGGAARGGRGSRGGGRGRGGRGASRGRGK